MKSTILRKLTCITAFLLTAAAVFAELNPPSRIFEIGVDVNAGVSNNYFDARDILTENVVFDLQKIAKEMPSGGLNFNAMFDADFFTAINASPKFRLTFFAGIDGTGSVNIPNELFALLADGNAIGESESMKINGSASVFADIGFTYRTQIKTSYGDFGLKFTPAYYLPIAYVPDVNATVNYSTSDTGVLQATASAPVSVYSIIDLQQFIDSDASSPDIQGQIADALRCGGFDFAFEAEHPVLRSLEVGVFTRIPILPGYLKHEMTANAWATATYNNILGMLDDTNSSDVDHGVDDFTYSETSYKIYRPFRLGVEGAWRPFGTWCTFRPGFAVVSRCPYTSDAVWYPEYRFDAEFSLFNIVALNFGTAYQDQLFIQRVGFMLNTHVIQFNVQASLEGSDFVNSFSWGGAGVYAGVRIGY